MDWENFSDTYGGSGGIPNTRAIMRYLGGVIHRERERVAQILLANGIDKRIADAILDDGQDAKVFQFRPPMTKLDDPIKRTAPKDAPPAEG